MLSGKLRVTHCALCNFSLINMAKRRYGIFNMYMTTTISVSLVLFFVGLISILFVTTHELAGNIRENFSISVVLSEDLDSVGSDALRRDLMCSDYVSGVTYLSKADALDEYVTYLGDNPADYLGYNPLLASLELTLNDVYAHIDSVEVIEDRLLAYEGVERVVYSKETLDLLSSNISTVSWVLLLLTGLLLSVSLVLISNTIRLSVYSKRFLINTMKLVGAKPWTIRAPFVRTNMLMGIFAACLASAMIYGLFYYLQYELGLLFLLSDLKLLVAVALLLVALGVLMGFLSSYVSVGRYIRMKTNDLYYV